MKPTATTKKNSREEISFAAIWAAVIFAVAFLGPNAFGTEMSADKTRPMNEMEGGCENFAMPLTRELSLWDQSELRVQGAQDEKSTTTLPTGRKVSLSLYPQKKVILPAKPEKDTTKGKSEGAFAGLALIEVKDDGVYRIAMGSRVWLDVVESENEEAAARIVAPNKFEMQTGCKKIFKAAEYSLKSGKRYFLQITASREPAMQVMTNFIK